MPPPPREHAVELALGPEEALGALARCADGWGAEFTRDGDGGRLALPVTAGLRQGWVKGRVSVTGGGAGARLVLAVDEADYRLHPSAVGVLLLALAGGLAVVLWPFYPRLIVVAPLGAALALGAWLLVLSKLTTSGPEEFLAAVAAEARGPGGA
jgi:hypothetical protein